MTRSRMYRDGRLVAEDFPDEDLARYLDDPDAVVWVDLAQPSGDDLAMLADKLGLHDLAVRDAVRAHQRPRLNHYQGHALVITYVAVVNPKSGVLHAHELAIFVTEHALITVRKDDGIDPGQFTDRWDNQSELAGSGVGFLLYGVLDEVVNAHLDALQVLDDHAESLEEAVFTESPTSTTMQRRMLRMHKSLGQLRRKVVPMEPVLNSLMRRDTTVYDQRMVPYYQDALDHVLYAADQIESLRDLIATIRDTQLNLQGNRLNLIMKKVTSWAAIIAVPTLITGFYGQNLPLPGVNTPWGAWVSTVSLVLVSVLLYGSFKRKDWL
ncbi:magnesium transporter CorA family protein [Actinocrispum wychmicini]|uniref:Magnesium transporter n=1 Tax=Actinocrispum wychmicini TaxID=1213861 RepID=A0A4R2IUV8_9PSEU|nr:magnesium transporter CorA family protein [Actinocrispum wychmicini]TCO48887.1 magnesium transporter [Actinocrispum wychmicini]